jgi:pimeloyl-ACP methyl ester carboxylesterase
MISAFTKRIYVNIFILFIVTTASGFSESTFSPGDIIDIEETGIVRKEEIREECFPYFKYYIIPSSHYDVATYRIIYRSTDVDGSPADITAQLFVPVFEQETERPLYVFGSGTTGIADQCAPSIEDPAVRVLGHYRGYTMSFAGLGYISIIPDYLGFNDPARPQRYFSKAAEAHVMLDAVRAVRNFSEQTGNGAVPSEKVFLSGYSQGGHAAFAAADLRDEYAPEIRITGVIGYGSTPNVTTLLKEGPRYAPHVLYSYSRIYDDIDPAKYLKEEWAVSLAEDVAVMCVTEFQRYYPRDARELYRPEFHRALYHGNLEDEFPGLYRRLEENKSGLSGHGIPSLIIQGARDTIITTPSQTDFAEELCGTGSPVKYVVLEGVYHKYTRAAGFQAAVLWMNRLVRGKKPESDCRLFN